MEQNITVKIERNAVFLVQDIVYDQVSVNMHIMNRPMRLDLLRPMSEGPVPLIMWIEGGAWKNLNKSFALPELQYLAEAGYAVASVEYRQSNEGKFPAGLKDVQAAVRYLTQEAERFQLRMDKIGLMGRSAGGNLATLIAAAFAGSQASPAPGGAALPGICGVVSMYAISDFSQYYEVMEERRRKEFLQNIEAYLGGKPSEKKAVAKKASPALQVCPGMAPHLLLQGTNDPIVPPEQTRILYEALLSKEVPAELYMLEGAGHGTTEFDQPAIKELILKFWEKRFS